MRESQTGDGNSQYGTMWIHNIDLELNRKVPKDLDIPEGWRKGRVIDFQKRKEKESKQKKKVSKVQEQKLVKEKDHNALVKKYEEWYSLYNEVGFERFCSITGYDKSKPNLVMRFKKYVKDFKPQNGKRRGAKRSV